MPQKRLVSAAVAAFVAAPGVVLAFAVRSEWPVPDARVIGAAVVVASIVGWTLAPRGGRPGFLYHLLRDALLAAMIFSLPAAVALILTVLTSGDAGLPNNVVGVLVGFVAGTAWTWLVCLPLASPFALVWALVMRLVPGDPA
jgi:presenilin-like A22 family membrane protease